MKNLLSGSRYVGKTLAFACAASIVVSPLMGQAIAAPKSSPKEKSTKSDKSKRQQDVVAQILKNIEGALGRTLTAEERQEIIAAAEKREAAFEAALSSKNSEESRAKAIKAAQEEFMTSVAKTLDMTLEELTKLLADYATNRKGKPKQGGASGTECKDKSTQSSGTTNSGSTGSTSSY